MIIKENMQWPPSDYSAIKMAEHSAWYSGDIETLATFYSTMPQNLANVGLTSKRETFWSRQRVNKSQAYNHVPIASDIAEMSASFLFSESPIIRFGDAKKNKTDQEAFDLLMDKTDFFKKLIDSAEICAALGGAYIKLAWDSDVSEYPIPVIQQPDHAIPEFRFGMLSAVTFWQSFQGDKEVIFRLFERYEKGAIRSTLYKGRRDKLGKEVPINSIEETKDIQPVVSHPDYLFACYIPNLLPNRLVRESSLGRSDLLGLEGMMDALDEAYSLWCRELTLSQAKLLVPEQYLRKQNGVDTFNVDRTLYVGLDIDPVTAGASNLITPQQFELRSDDYERTTLNFLERIITSAGYSPQSFGLNIQGRTESGTALNIRERRSFLTKNKKEKYWSSPMEHIIRGMLVLWKSELGGTIDPDLDMSISFSDSVTSNMGDIAESIAKITNAQAASIETKVKLLHPEWTEEDVQAEVERIKEENSIGVAPTPDNFDLQELNEIDKADEDEDEEEQDEEAEE